MKRIIYVLILGILAVFFSVFFSEKAVTPDLAAENPCTASGSAVVLGGRTFTPYSGETATPSGSQPNAPDGKTAMPSGNRPNAPDGETAMPSGNRPNAPDGKTAMPSGDVNVTPSVSPAWSAGSHNSPKPSGYKKIHSDKPVKDYGNGVISIGDTAYEQYSYVGTMANRYAGLVNKMAKKLGDKVKVYDMIVPTSMGIILPDNKKNKVNSSDQGKALDKIHGMLSRNVIKVPVYNSLMEHRTEYVYFRTDHHWTQLGAYYAYEVFCRTKGIEPHALSDYKKDSFGKYLGSFYTDCNNNGELRADNMKVYYPVSNKELSAKYTDKSGRTYDGKVIENGKPYSVSLKYVSLIDGDNPYTVITNNSIKDKSSIIVVKESFGNALAPFLADHYHRVYVVDYRYWEGDLNKLVREKKASEILYINNISMTRNSYLIGRFAAITGE